MADYSGYTITLGNERYRNRQIVCFSLDDGRVTKTTPAGTSTFVPASPLDGQALAGTGALVFEGELLELPRRR